MSADVIALPKAAPHDADAERGLLGAVLLWSSRPDAGAVHEIVARLDPATFYRPAHASIAEAMVRLRDRGDAIDTQPVWAELGAMRRQQTTGGFPYLVELSNHCGIPSTALRLERRVRALAHRRALIAGYREGLAHLEAEGEDVAAAADAAMAAVLAVRGLGTARGPRHIRELSHEVYGEMERTACGGAPPGFLTGLLALDEVLDPLEPGELILFGARPSTGKTAVALAVTFNIALHVLRTVLARGERGSVLFFSLETTDTKLARRAVANASGVGLSVISGRVPASPEAVRLVQAGIARLERLPIWIDDRFGLPISELRATCRAHQRDHGLSLIVVDYLQLLKGTAKREGKRVDEVAEVSRELKALAKEFGVPVIALAQLNREVEKRAEKRPQLSDLRECGQIEQDADKVVLLHRENKQSKQLVAIIAKQRDGAADVDAILEFDGATMGFGGIDHDDRAEPASVLDEAPPAGAHEWGGPSAEEYDDAPF